MREYPKDIIPNSKYKHRLKFKPLLDLYPDLMVLRMVGKEYAECTDDGTAEGNLTDKIFDGSVQNLSMNLLGGLYKIEHESFLPQKEAAETSWNGGDVDFEKYRESYIDKNPCFHVCFHVKDIHNTTYPFPITFQKEDERNAMADKVREMFENDTELQIDQDVVEKFVDANSKVNVQVKMTLVHRPNLLNYWHVTLDTTRPDNPDFVMPGEKLNSRDRKQMKAFKQHLVQIMFVTNEVSYKLKRSDYMEKLTCCDIILDKLGK